MIETPYITHSETQLTALIHLTIPRADIQSVMEPALRELRTVLAGQGIRPTGPWLTHHLKIDPQTFDFEVCMPVGKEVVAKGRVQPGQLSAAKVARTIYRGPYEGLPKAWGEFGKWIAQYGYTVREDVWECYLAGPESSTDPAEWRTELNRPLAW